MNKTTFARNLRKNQTDAEKKLWRYLRNRQLKDFKFRRQYVIDGYIADFACVEAKLIIELDGGQHLEQQAYDEKRTQSLSQQGFRVLRFWNDEVLKQTDDVLNVIYEALEPPSPQPSPSKRERELNVGLGLGCDRGTPHETIEKAIHDALALVNLTVNDVVAAASIDKKSDEIGLLSVCSHFNWDCTWYAAAELAKVDVPNPSEVVMKYVGTPSVGEAAAILLADGSKEDLIVEKYKYRGHDGKNATVSICRIQESSLPLKGEG
jgi:cobalt-precorrin 5A hydrolase